MKILILIFIGCLLLQETFIVATNGFNQENDQQIKTDEKSTGNVEKRNMGSCQGKNKNLLTIVTNVDKELLCMCFEFLHFVDYFYFFNRCDKALGFEENSFKKKYQTCFVSSKTRFYGKNSIMQEFFDFETENVMACQRSPPIPAFCEVKQYFVMNFGKGYELEAVLFKNGNLEFFSHPVEKYDHFVEWTNIHFLFPKECMFNGRDKHCTFYANSGEADKAFHIELVNKKRFCIRTTRPTQRGNILQIMSPYSLYFKMTDDIPEQIFYVYWSIFNNANVGDSQQNLITEKVEFFGWNNFYEMGTPEATAEVIQDDENPDKIFFRINKIDVTLQEFVEKYLISFKYSGKFESEFKW